MDEGNYSTFVKQNIELDYIFTLLIRVLICNSYINFHFCYFTFILNGAFKKHETEFQCFLYSYNLIHLILWEM